MLFTQYLIIMLHMNHNPSSRRLSSPEGLSAEVTPATAQRILVTVESSGKCIGSAGRASGLTPMGRASDTLQGW